MEKKEFSRREKRYWEEFKVKFVCICVCIIEIGKDRSS